MSQDNFGDPLNLLLIAALTAALNPVVTLVAYVLGARADQWQKLPVAAFAAAIAGFLALLAVTLMGLVKSHGHGHASGIMVFQFLFGLGWAWLGYTRRGR